MISFPISYTLEIQCFTDIIFTIDLIDSAVFKMLELCTNGYII